MRKQLFGVVSVVALAGLVGLAAGCGGGDDDDDDDITINPDATPGPDRDPSGGDGNDSFADAEEVTIDDPDGVTGRIQEPGDHDFFKFEGTAGVWLQIVIVANTQDDNTFVDTVIQIYDESMTLIAENDDAVPRLTTDSEVIIRLPTTGTYYVEVLEFSEWFPLPPYKGEDTFNFEYRLKAFVVNPAAAGVLEDPENGDDIGSAVDAKFTTDIDERIVGLIIGDFDDNTDVDVFRLALPAGLTPPISLYTAIAPGGETGYGSTTSAGDVYITNLAGNEIIARIDATTGAFLVSPPIQPDTDYLVWIEHPGEASGANDFYVYKFVIAGDNPPEIEATSGQNDTAATAELLTISGTAFFILANIQDGGDVDYFKFNAGAGSAISVFCSGQNAGSGIRGFTAQVRDQDDAVLASQLEPVGESVSIQGVNAPYSGDYYLRLSKSGQDAAVTSRFARCGVGVQ